MFLANFTLIIGGGKGIFFAGYFCATVNRPCILMESLENVSGQELITTSVAT